MSTKTAAEWLAGVQEQMGITYTPDDAEKRLRALLREIAWGLVQTALVETIGVEYHGYTSRPTAEGEKRTTMRKLTASLQLGDGTIYGLTLHGPMNVGGLPVAGGEGAS